MCVGTLRTMYHGWVDRLYVEPAYFFKFYGFDWVTPLGREGMYLVFWGMAISALLVALGWMYRAAIILFFLLFTYVELIDITNYLNHYYLVCILAFLLIFLPANRAYSIDSWRNPALRKDTIPSWCINIIKLQLAIVYFFAGLAKLNPDWIIHAMPLAIWLPTKVDVPVIGWLFQYSWVPHAFSWAGAFYDLTIAFFLLNRKTRPFAYFVVIAFHSMTWALFNIGLFPFIMTFSTLIFFSEGFHKQLLKIIIPWSNSNTDGIRKTLNRLRTAYRFPYRTQRFIKPLLFAFILLQVGLPMRCILYPGELFWTEEGYRFSWRVMLMEKNGQITFRIHNPATGNYSEVDNSKYLTEFQEKQLSTQPDLIVQFARFLKEEYARKYEIDNLKVTADCYVSLNGRPSQQFIDPEVDLSALPNTLAHQTWVLPFKEQKSKTQLSKID